MRAWAFWNVRAWSLWQEPRRVTALVVLLITAEAGAIAASAATVQFRPRQLILFGLLVACVTITVELTRQEGEKKGLVKDVYSAWGLPAAILLPPLFVLLMTPLYYLLIQLRIRKTAFHRRMFSGAAVGLSFGMAGMVFRWLQQTMLPPSSLEVAHNFVWCLILLVAVLIYSVMNKFLVILAIKGSDPTADIRKEFFGREPLYNDLAEQCIGALVTYAVATNLFLVPVALPVVALLQRSLRHAQLLKASRTDAKTGLLNARAWESEAESELTRAVRARMALAVCVLDIDFFKLVNDTYGHLFGDEVLKEIAHCLPGVLREYDSAGRFGGEEFVLLLPHTRAVDAFRIADRVRDHISGLSFRTSDGQQAQVTVSVGVAALDAGSTRELSELLAAADAALYRAKRDGRNQVQMISTTRGLSASGARAADTVNAFGISSPTASVWDVAPRPAPQHSSDADGLTVIALPHR
ncbi:MAG TPA: GGDEF domain-containing protein [Streptosporangiaceae bacterium]|nr:GGDEF domain-containing protein [Streptosporangiaceae bacterium]